MVPESLRGMPAGKAWTLREARLPKARRKADEYIVATREIVKCDRPEGRKYENAAHCRMLLSSHALYTDK